MAPSAPAITPSPTIALTERGRIRAVLVSLEQRWENLSTQQQAHALELLAELSACYRRRDGCRGI